MFPRISSVDERVRLSEQFPRIRDAEKRMKEHEKLVREIYGGDTKSSVASTKSKNKNKIPSKKTTKKLNLAQSMSTITLNSYDGTAGSPEDEGPSKGNENIYNVFYFIYSQLLIIITDE